MKNALPLELLKEVPGENITFTAAPVPALRAALAGRSKTLIVTGARSAKHCGALDAATEAAALPGSEVEVFSGVPPEPDLATVDQLVARIRAFAPDAVLAVGGGSAMDAAKAALLTVCSGRRIEDLFGVEAYSKTVFPGTPVPRRIIAVPTTSGTGSEVTPYSNIVDRVNQVKRLISERAIVPESAVVVPGFAKFMPREVALATGCDALAHLIEGFLNVGADDKHPRANVWAVTGIKLVKQFLARRLADPDDAEAVEALSFASTLGGMTIRFKSTGLPHLCSFSWFGRIAHGTAAAMLLPASWRYYLGNPAVEKRTLELSDVFPGRNAAEIVNSFRCFLDGLGVPRALREFPDITPELLAATARSGAQNRMKLELAPRPVPLEASKKILSAILEQAYSGE